WPDAVAVRVAEPVVAALPVAREERLEEFARARLSSVPLVGGALDATLLDRAIQLRPGHDSDTGSIPEAVEDACDICEHAPAFGRVVGRRPQRARLAARVRRGDKRSGAGDVRRPPAAGAPGMQRVRTVRPVAWNAGRDDLAGRGRRRGTAEEPHDRPSVDGVVQRLA